MRTPEQHTRPTRIALSVLAVMLIVTAIFLVSPSHLNVHAAALYTPPASNRVDININPTWKFHLGDVPGAQKTNFDDSSWTSLDLPYTWNNLDGQNGGPYYQGIGWYRKHYTVDPSYTGRRFYLQFDGSNLVTDVYVNGTLLGEHQGGYATFRFDATAVMNVGSDNVIAVKVNNAYNADIAPLWGDYIFCGGIYREVHLVVTDNVHMLMTNDYGSSGLYLATTNVGPSSADLQVTAKTFNDNSIAENVTLQAVVVDANGSIVTTLTASQTEAAHSEYDFVQSTTITNPHLWNGVQDPYLYRVYAQVQLGNTVTDLVVQPLGFRFFRLDPKQGFFLNGQYLDLHGVSMLQDRLNKGWAVSTSDLDQDFGFVSEIGANALRLADYQQDQHIYDLSDSHGVIIWAEIPLINHIATSQKFSTNIQQQLLELIRQNYNHPSIIFWSIANEVSIKPDPNALLSQLNALAHTEDPSRITTVAVCIATRVSELLGASGNSQKKQPCIFSDTDPITKHTDTRGYNQYFGWYFGSYKDFGNWADGFHSKNPNTSFAISEFGAGASIYQHQDNPPPPVFAGYFHPEEYQATLHEALWQQMAARPYIWGKFIWNLFDFASNSRNEGDSAGRNDKGLVTYDRQTRKDAFYWYKANWSSSPFVYITDRRYTNRNIATTDIKVYANTSSVELRLNGVSLGSKSSSDHIFTWPGVILASGSNTVDAIGTLNGNTYTDEVIWNLSPNVLVDAGARMPYTDSGNNIYDVDHYYTLGTTGYTSHAISNTPDPSEYQTYRLGTHLGTFNYSIPLANGSYTVTLKFMEPTMTHSGQRVFSVGAEGVTVLQNEDIYSEVGQYAALQKSFSVTVRDGTLDLGFTPSVNYAIISAIAIIKQ